MTVKSLPDNQCKVKAGVLTADEEDRAMPEGNLSASSAPSGVRTSAFFVAPPDGSNAENSAEGVPSLPPVSLILRVPNSDTRGNTGIVEAFREYRYMLEHKPVAYLHMRNKLDNSTVLYRRTGYSRSRYFLSGRAARIKEIRRRLSTDLMEGVFFTLTVDAKRYSMAEAWEGMWPRWNGFKDALNVYRKRHMNYPRGFPYLAILEQCKSGYPHLHVYCPGMKWLIKKKDLGKLTDWWKMGGHDVKKAKRCDDSALGYILKYITKMDGWTEETMALLWHYKVRNYNMSRRYSKGKQDSEWEVLDNFGSLEELSDGLNLKIKDAESLLEAFSEVGADLIDMKPPEEAPE